MSPLFDPIRRIFVPDLPEERVRQKWLQVMIQELGFPRGLISVEKEIPGIERRLDILCYTPQLQPLLLMECKKKVSGKALQQVIGYNREVRAYFLCLAFPLSCTIYWRTQGGYQSHNGLPYYEELLKAVARGN